MQYIWHNDRYLPLGIASIKPVLTGTVIGSVLLKFPDTPEFPVTSQRDVQAILEYALRNNVSSLVGQAEAPKTQFVAQQNGNGKKRTFSNVSTELMRQKRIDYWKEHPERWSKAHRKAAGLE